MQTLDLKLQTFFFFCRFCNLQEPFKKKIIQFLKRIRILNQASETKKAVAELKPIFPIEREKKNTSDLPFPIEKKNRNPCSHTMRIVECNREKQETGE